MKDRNFTEGRKSIRVSGSKNDCEAPCLEERGFVPIEFSKKYFSQGIVDYIEHDENLGLLDEKIAKFSKIYKDITTIPKCDNTVFKNQYIKKEGRLSILNNQNELGIFIYNIIKASANIESKKLLCIKSPIGSYKNRLLQYIYLKIAKELKSFLPFYIDLSLVERDPNITIETIIKEIGFVKTKLAGKPLLLILDNVRLFQCGFNYEKLFNYLRNVNCKIVVGADVSFTMNPHRSLGFNDPLIPETMFSYEINITSMNLNRCEECKDFIENCIKVFKDEHTSMKPLATTPRDIERLRDFFVKNQLIVLDAHRLKEFLIKKKSLKEEDLSSGIISLYDEAHSCVESDYKNAYLYEYTDSVVRFSGDWWQKITKHRSILDYFVAKYYAILLSNAIENNAPSLPNLVLPKNISRFLIPMITSGNHWEELINYIYGNYEKYDVVVRSQLVYFLGRVPNLLIRKRNISEKLADWKKIEQERYETESDEYQKKLRAFLLRSINVSLIYLGEFDALYSYMECLMTDKVFNEINRGFHLDYYGDKIVYWSGTGERVNLLDVIDKGKKTLLKLSIDIQAKLNLEITDSPETYVLILQLITYCDLIEARKNKIRDEWYLEYKEIRHAFVEKFLSLVEKNQNFKNKIGKIFSYFQKIRKDNIIEYNKYNRELNKARAGWERRRVDYPESISAHMYNVWLMGIMYLPEQVDHLQDKENYSDYDKHKILQLLLIHDLGEAVIGDIIRGEKEESKKKEEEEAINEIIKKYFPQDANEYFQLWKDSESGMPQNINAKIAKEIDYIQGVYQFCCYCVNKKIVFNSSDWKKWCEDIHFVKSTLGEELLKKAIFENPEFKGESALAKNIRKQKKFFELN